MQFRDLEPTREQAKAWFPYYRVERVDCPKFAQTIGTIIRKLSGAIQRVQTIAIAWIASSSVRTMG